MYAASAPLTMTTSEPAERVGVRALHPSPVAASGQLQDRPVRIGGISGGEDDHFGVLGHLLERPQQVERGWQRELRRANATREVATANTTGVLESFQHVIDRAETAGDAFGSGDFARQHAVASQELLRARRSGLRRRCHCLPEDGPAALGSRRRHAPAPEPAGAWPPCALPKSA